MESLPRLSLILLPQKLPPGDVAYLEISIDDQLGACANVNFSIYYEWRRKLVVKKASLTRPTMILPSFFSVAPIVEQFILCTRMCSGREGF
jgi:hypothetical protein